MSPSTWAIKEEFHWFWRHVYPRSAEEFFSQWYAWGVRCRLRPVIKFAKMRKRHLPNLLSYFRHRITNATSEGFNSVIRALKYAARGFRSFQNYRTRILFFCGKLDLRPRIPLPLKCRKNQKTSLWNGRYAWLGSQQGLQQRRARSRTADHENRILCKKPISLWGWSHPVTPLQGSSAGG
jgi:hypothetical protein